MKMTEIADAQSRDKKWQARLKAVVAGASTDKEVQGWLERHENQFVVK